MESVKQLLRDGKFYAAPESGPERLGLARLALESKERGMTRTEFQDGHLLSNQKAVESWRDSRVPDVLDEARSYEDRAPSDQLGTRSVSPVVAAT